RERHAGAATDEDGRLQGQGSRTDGRARRAPALKSAQADRDRPRLAGARHRLPELAAPAREVGPGTGPLLARPAACDRGRPAYRLSAVSRARLRRGRLDAYGRLARTVRLACRVRGDDLRLAALFGAVK